jgi:hypothetical protein
MFIGYGIFKLICQLQQYTAGFSKVFSRILLIKSILWPRSGGYSQALAGNAVSLLLASTYSWVIHSILECMKYCSGTQVLGNVIWPKISPGK